MNSVNIHSLTDMKCTCSWDILGRYWLCYVCVLLDILDRYWPRYVCILLDDVYGEDDEAEELYDDDDQHISAAALLGHTGIVGSL